MAEGEVESPLIAAEPIRDGDIGRTVRDGGVREGDAAVGPAFRPKPHEIVCGMIPDEAGGSLPDIAAAVVAAAEGKAN